MALKALDQRMAGSAPTTSQNGTTSQTQSPRTPAAAVPPTPTPAVAPTEDDSEDEADIGDTSDAKE